MKLIIAVITVVVFAHLGILSFAATFILAVTVHELGHLTAARLFGAKVLSIDTSLLGIRIRYSDMSLGTLAECTVCASGSLAGILTAMVLGATPLIRYDIILQFVTVSLTLAILNLLPIRGLDGGAIVGRILDRFMLPDRSERVMNVLSGAVSLSLWLISIRIQLRSGINLSLLVLSVYILIASLRRT